MITYDQIKESFKDLQDNTFNKQPACFIRIRMGVYIYADLHKQNFDLHVETKYTELKGVKSITDLVTISNIIKG